MVKDGIMLKIVRGITPVILIAMAVGVTVWLIKTRPEPAKQKPPKPQLLVETIEARAATNQITLEARGTVNPDESVDIQPEVTGLVVWKNPDLIPGGIIEEGETLIRIDSRNYEVAVKQAESNLKQAEVDLELEKSRRAIAAEEWEMLGPDEESIEPRSKDLALRKPQIKAARARLQAASNALAKAELDMDRTRIECPFNAIVLNDYVDRGQLVSPQTRVASLAGTDSFLAEVSLPVPDLDLMEWPSEDGTGGAKTTIEYERGQAEALRFEGRVVRVLGNLGNPGRLARLLVRIEDPLNLEGADPSQRLFANSYVKCLIAGKRAADTFKLPGQVVREGGKAWIMNESDQLEIKDIEILRRQAGKVLIEAGLEEGDRVITSHIAVPMPGMALKEKGEGKK